MCNTRWHGQQRMGATAAPLVLTCAPVILACSAASGNLFKLLAHGAKGDDSVLHLRPRWPTERNDDGYSEGWTDHRNQHTAVGLRPGDHLRRQRRACAMAQPMAGFG